MIGDISDYLSNERTFLSWIRTSVGIMALGFVIEKFALFKQIMSVEEANQSIMISPSLLYFDGYSNHLGNFLIAFAAVMSFVAFLQFKRVAKEIHENTYFPSTFLCALVTFVLVSVALFLLIFLR